MHHRIRGVPAVLALVLGGVAPLVMSACGSDSSGQARSLLKQTFAGHHRVDSGNLSFNLTVNPSGSSTFNSPLTLSFAGPFQSLGTGKLPQSNFTVTISGFGTTASLGLISTGQSGFVTLQGTSYQMPAATFQKLESSFSGLTSSGNGSSAAGTLGGLGVDPLKWLVKPSIVGSESVGGTDTTHIRAGVNVAMLLGDLNTLLQKATSLGVGNATGLGGASNAQLGRNVQHPRFDVWTGKSDKTPRKLAIELRLPVSGQISSALGGLRSADVSLNMQYANLNQPQTITAPTSVRPFSEFAAKLGGLGQAFQGLLGGTASTGTGGTTGSTGSTGTTGPSTGTTGASTGSAGSAGTSTGAATTTGSSSTVAPSTPASVQSYSQCIQAAGTDVTKMQSCAPLLQAK